MNNKTIYRHADKALKRLYRHLEAAMQRLATTATWDELNVIGAVKEVYNDSEKRAFNEYLTVAEKAYADAGKEVLALLPNKKDSLKGITALFIMALLLGYDPKTQYVYKHEVERKEARLSESLIAVNQHADLFNNQETRAALLRALRLYERQMRNMADTVTDEARIQAFDDVGIEKVTWITQRDRKVCSICRERDGQVYSIRSVPEKHPNCRCYLIPVIPVQD